MLPFKLAFLNFLDHRIFKKDYEYFHEGNTFSFSENCLVKCHWCSVFVTLEVTDQIYPVHHHHHYCHNNENHKKLSVCLFLSALQTYFTLRGQFGFLFCLFVLCCAIAPVTKFVDARLCQLQSEKRVVFSIMLSKYFHSLEDAPFNSVDWKI